MADTINDLYLKYVNSVGSTLEDDRYFRYLFEIVQAGANTLRQNHQVLHKVVDERWLTTIEESLDALNRITEHPRRFITSTEELVPVELARKITEREYDGIINFAIDEGITKAFIQEGGTAEESFIPPFDLTGADAK